MKICFINNRFGTGAKGGAETVISSLVDYLKQKEMGILIFSCDAKSHREDSDGVKTIYFKSRFSNYGGIPRPIRLFEHSRSIFGWSMANSMNWHIKINGCHVVVTNNLIGMSFRTGDFVPSNCRHIHILHDIQLLHPSGLMYYGSEGVIDTPWAMTYQKMVKRALGEPDMVLSPSRWLLDLHKDRGFFTKGSNSFVLRNPIGTGAYKPVKTDDSKPTFLFVGQMEEHKGIKMLLNVAKRMSRENKNACRFKFVGDGSLSNSVKGEGIENLGRLDRASVERSMLEASFLVIPSLCYENSPSVIYEAKATGLPVIASRIGGIPELLGKQDISFAPGNEQELYDIFEKIIKKINPSLGIDKSSEILGTKQEDYCQYLLS